MKREKTQSNKIRNQKQDITTNSSVIQRILREFKSLYSNKLKNLKQMDKFLDTCNLPKLK
jgi:hypothetical protein